MTYTKARHPLGFYQAQPTPSQDELEKHYRDRYFQGGNECYLPEYTAEEKIFFRNRAVVTEHVWQSHSPKKSGRMIDVGCGEGFVAAYFAERGWAVEACDFSSHAITKHNPQIAPFFTQGNIYSLLDERIASSARYDLINLSNVLEHVRDPLGLLERMKRLMDTSSVLQITVPNDFSGLQNLLVKKGLTGETWFLPPEHLNYFTVESLKTVLGEKKFRVIKIIAAFPIEIFLFNEHSNYWVDRKKGKAANRARIEMDNFLINQGVDKYVDYMRGAAECNFGRNIHAYVSL